MSKSSLPEHVPHGAEQLTAVAVLVGIIAVGAAFLKHIFNVGKNKTEK